MIGGGSRSNHFNSAPPVTRQASPVPSAATSAAKRRAGDGGHSPIVRRPVLALPFGSPRNVPCRNSADTVSISRQARATSNGSP